MFGKLGVERKPLIPLVCESEKAYIKKVVVRTH